MDGRTGGWKEQEGYTERDRKWMCVRERTRGVSGKGVDFPREALSEKKTEREKEREIGTQSGWGLERSNVVSSSLTGQLPAGPTAQHQEESLKEFPPKYILFTAKTDLETGNYNDNYYNF